MKNRLDHSMMVITLMIMSLLFSCASAERKQSESRDADFYNKRGVELGMKGQYDQAILDFNKALKINPGYADVYNNRGIAYGGKGQYDQAILNFNKALEINPGYADAYYNRGIVYYSKKEYAKSWDDIKKAQDLGGQIPPKFLEDLRKASGRQK